MSSRECVSENNANSGELTTFTPHYTADQPETISKHIS